MAKYSGSDMSVSFGGVEFDAVVSSVDISQSSDYYTDTSTGGLHSVISGPAYTTATVTFEALGDVVATLPSPGERGRLGYGPSQPEEAEWKIDTLVKMFKNQDYSRLALDAAGITQEDVQKVGDDFNSYLDDRIWHWNSDDAEPEYMTILGNKYRVTRDENGIISEAFLADKGESDEEVTEMMKKVYFVYAVSRKTEALWSIGPVVGDHSPRVAKEAFTLEHADAIKALGDPADIKVWLEEVGDFEAIESE